MVRNIFFGAALLLNMSLVFEACSGDSSSSSSDEDSVPESSQSDPEENSSSSNKSEKLSSNSKTNRNNASEDDEESSEKSNKSSGNEQKSSGKENSDKSSSSSEDSMLLVDQYGWCYPDINPATIGDTVTWYLIRDPSLFSMGDAVESSYQWTFDKTSAAPVEGINGIKAKVVYNSIGDKETSLKVIHGTEYSVIPCEEILLVTGKPITGCECTSEASTIDLANSDSVMTWHIGNCDSDSPITQFKWIDAEGDSEIGKAKFSESFTKIKPSVIVTNKNMANLRVACNEVKSMNSEKPEFTMTSENIYYDLPEGTSFVEIEPTPDNPYALSSCTLACSFMTVNGTMTIDDYTSYQSYYVSLNLPESYCKTGKIFKITLTAPAQCSIH